MQVTVKAKFNASRQRIEPYGNNKYLVYLETPNDANTNFILITMLSRYLGVPVKSINFQKTDMDGNKVFELS